MRPADDSALLLQTIAMPADANPSGDIFGGWLLSQMDLAGAVAAIQEANGRVATIGIEAMKFHRPVMVGDVVSCFGKIARVGNTSISVKLETWIRRGRTEPWDKVTKGLFTYVAIDADRKPRPVRL